MKKITSLSLGFSFLIMTYTGIMLFLSPHGRVAYWSDWHLFGLSKTQYGELHTTSMITILIFGILHIYYNWKPIVSYMKNKSKKISFTKKEFLIAFGLNLLFVVGTLTMIQPFKGFLDFNENIIKEYWTTQYGEPPYGHAEQTKLKVFCRKMNIELSYAKNILKSSGISFNENEDLQTIAKNNSLTPNDIYQLINQKSVNKDIPNNIGRKTLQNLETLGKINLADSIALLQARGLTDVTAKSKIRNIADELELNPLDLYKLLIKDENI